MLKYDLGGTTYVRGSGFLSVNAVPPCDVQLNIMDIDKLCADDTVDEFMMSHTLEHIPITEYPTFLKTLFRKLKSGGKLTIIQTDVGALLKLYASGELNFRSMRTPIFTPADRIRDNEYQQHQNMWDVQTMIEDLQWAGFAAQSFDAGSWSYDQIDDLYPHLTKRYHGVKIPNLGVRGSKP